MCISAAMCEAEGVCDIFTRITTFGKNTFTLQQRPKASWSAVVRIYEFLTINIVQCKVIDFFSYSKKIQLLKSNEKIFENSHTLGGIIQNYYTLK